MTSFFHLLFRLQLFVTFIFVFENNQNLFSCGPPFVSFWSVKYLKFGQQLLIWTVHHTFLKSRHPEVTKNPCYVLFPEGNQKMVSTRNFDNKNNFKSFFRKAKKYVLSSLISAQQTAYIKSRFIGECGRLISDKVDICHRYNIGGYLVAIDIEKAFDSLHHKFIFAVLKEKLVLVKVSSPGFRHY